MDTKLFNLTAILMTISIIASYTLTTFTTLLYHVPQFYFFFHQMVYVGLALGTMWAIAHIHSLTWINRLGLTLFVVFFLVMIVMVFLPSSVVKAVGGAKRWIHLGFINIAPVEFFKIGFVYFLAWSFNRKFHKYPSTTFKQELLITLPYMILFLIAAVLIAIFQNDIGQVTVLGLTFVFMLVLAGRSLKLFFFLLGSSIFLFLFFVSISEHRIHRIKAWWASVQHTILSHFPNWIASNLTFDATKESYQIINSLNAIHNGGIIGQGLGNGAFKLGFLSEIHTDFVLAGLTEELGWIGIAAIVFVYLFLIQRLMRIANRATHQITYLFSAGIAMLIGFSFIINSFGISSITPIKGLAVPLLSYGGSSMLATAIGIGIVLALSSLKETK